MGHGDQASYDNRDGRGFGATEAMVATIVVNVAEQLTTLPWDSPSLLFEVGLTASDDVTAELRRADIDLTGGAGGEVLGPAWTLSAPMPLDGHPFDALIGRRADPESVGVVLATEAWMAPTVHLRGPLADDLAQHATAEGRTEVRNVCLVLRDGTTAHAVAVRDGGIHLVGTAAGRVPAALRRMLGAPCGIRCETPAQVAARAWVHAALLSATTVGRSSAPRPENLPDGLSVADATLFAVANSDQLLAEVLPPALWWLVGQVRDDPAATWEVLLAAMVEEPDLDAVRWLLVSGSSSGWAHAPCDEAVAAEALQWCDPDMFGYLFDGIVPASDDLAASFSDTAAQAGITLSFPELAALAAGVLRGGHAE